LATRTSMGFCKPYVIMLLRPATSTLFPYTTLFRSRRLRDRHAGRRGIRRPELRRHLPAHRPLGRNLLRLARRHQRLRGAGRRSRSEEHTSELQSRENLVCRLLLEKKNKKPTATRIR